MFFGSMSVNVGAYCLKRGAADTADKIGPVPEQRFAVERGQVVSETVTGAAGAGALQVVHQDRYVKGRVDVHK